MFEPRTAHPSAISLCALSQTARGRDLRPTSGLNLVCALGLRLLQLGLVGIQASSDPCPSPIQERPVVAFNHQYGGSHRTGQAQRR